MPVKPGASPGGAVAADALKAMWIYFFGGLFGGWHDPHGLLFVTYCGRASTSTELNATTAPAINSAPASPVTPICQRVRAP